MYRTVKSVVLFTMKLQVDFYVIFSTHGHSLTFNLWLVTRREKFKLVSFLLHQRLWHSSTHYKVPVRPNAANRKTTARTAEPSTSLSKCHQPWISAIFRSCIWIFSVSEHDARVCKHSFGYCNKETEEASCISYLSLLPVQRNMREPQR